jgi:hypothetical protein
VHRANNFTTFMCRCLETWEPQPPGTLRVCPGLYRDSFSSLPLSEGPSQQETFQPSPPRGYNMCSDSHFTPSPFSSLSLSLSLVFFNGLIKDDAVKKYGGDAVEFHVFLSSPVHTRKWPALRPDRIIYGEKSRDILWLEGWPDLKAAIGALDMYKGVTPLPGIEHRFIGRSVRNVAPVLTELSQILMKEREACRSPCLP